MIIDGYTSYKRVRNAVLDIAKAVDEINPGEGEFLVGCLDDGGVFNLKSNDPYSYSFEMEEVPCACAWDEEKEEMMYAKGAWYFCLRCAC